MYEDDSLMDGPFGLFDDFVNALEMLHFLGLLGILAPLLELNEVSISGARGNASRELFISECRLCSNRGEFCALPPVAPGIVG